MKVLTRLTLWLNPNVSSTDGTLGFISAARTWWPNLCTWSVSRNLVYIPVCHSCHNSMHVPHTLMSQHVWSQMVAHHSSDWSEPLCVSGDGDASLHQDFLSCRWMNAQFASQVTPSDYTHSLPVVLDKPTSLFSHVPNLTEFCSFLGLCFRLSGDFRCFSSFRCLFSSSVLPHHLVIHHWLPGASESDLKHWNQSLIPLRHECCSTLHTALQEHQHH